MEVDDPEHYGDISIGNGIWIALDDSQSEFAVDITHQLEPISIFGYLEIHCVASCCRFEAFDFWPDAILEKAKRLDWEMELLKLENAKLEISKLTSDDMKSFVFNSHFKKESIVCLIEHCVRVIDTHRSFLVNPNRPRM